MGKELVFTWNPGHKTPSLFNGVQEREVYCTVGIPLMYLDPKENFSLQVGENKSPNRRRRAERSPSAEVAARFGLINREWSNR
jgi:hypothetical protein